MLQRKTFYFLIFTLPTPNFFLSLLRLFSPTIFLKQVGGARSPAAVRRDPKRDSCGCGACCSHAAVGGAGAGGPDLRFALSPPGV